MVTPERDSENGLYFVVGALVVAVAVIGFIYVYNTEDVNDIQPSAGIERSADEDRTDFNLRVDNNEVSGSATDRDRD